MEHSQEKIKVLTVVPCIGLWQQYTKNCIDSILNSELSENIENHILLINNGNDGETAVGIVAPEYLGKITVMNSDERMGCQKSWNYGFAYRTDLYKYKFVINNDVLIHRNCIAKLVERMERGDVIMATAMDIRQETTPQAFFDVAPKDEVPESEGLNFSAYMVRNDFVDKIGEADEAFAPAYFEDNDLHWRIRVSGEKAVVFPAAMFYHFGSRTQNSVPGGLVNGIMFNKNRSYFIMKWGGMPGKERFRNPFDDPKNSIRYTKQNPQ